MNKSFLDIINLIQHSRNNAVRAVNTELINLYWNVGAYIKQKLAVSEWGDKTVDELANFIQKTNPELKGFNRRGIYRMIQFYETYVETQLTSSVHNESQVIDNKNNEIVSPLVSQFKQQDIRATLLVKLTWTNHLIIFSRCKIEE